MKKYDIIISGYASLDRVVRTKNKIEICKTSLVANDDFNDVCYGGCSINVASRLAWFGYNTLPVLRLGDDAETSGMMGFLRETGISTDAVRLNKNVKTGATYLVESPEGDHITLFYPGAMDEKYFQDAEKSWFEQSKIGLMTVASHQDNLNFLNHCKEANIPLCLSFKMDPDAFPPEFLKEIFSYATVLFLNRKEAEYLIKLFRVATVSDLIGRTSIKCVVMTKGIEGSVGYESNILWEEDAVKVEKIVDSVGSGDAFVAGFLHGLLQEEKLSVRMRYGSVMASFALEGKGATGKVPSMEEWNNRIKNAERNDCNV